MKIHTGEVGKEGEPGHGFIHVGAGDHIATSLLTGESLHGNSSQVDIDQENMALLADGLQSLAEEQMDNASTYVDHSVDIVKDEGKKFDERITTMQEAFEQLIHETVGEPLFKGIARTGDALISCIDGLIGLLDSVEENAVFLSPFSIRNRLNLLNL